MAPSPLVGINPMMANNAVLTEIKVNISLRCFAEGTGSTLKRKKDSGFH